MTGHTPCSNDVDAPRPALSPHPHRFLDTLQLPLHQFNPSGTEETMTASSENNPICPRCGGYIPNNETPGAYPGALSRISTDPSEHIEICSACGLAEAMIQWSGLPLPTPDTWPLAAAHSREYGPPATPRETTT